MAVKDVLVWPMGKLDFSAGCLVMGILNVTPDSFSDGGRYFDTQAAVAHAVEMASQGASIIDVGPQSTRPGSVGVAASEQIRRAVPVIERLAQQIKIPISIDTSLPEVATAALDAGASIINDITALADVRMAELAAGRGAAVVLMHIQGTPAIMQDKPVYKDVTKEVLEFLVDKAALAQSRGIAKDRIFIDPGIGFGKTIEHNLRLLHDIGRFVETSYRVLVGTSRKRFIGQITARQKPESRIFGTAATVALCAAAGVSVVRVHDVAEMVDVVKLIHVVNQS